MIVFRKAVLLDRPPRTRWQVVCDSGLIHSVKPEDESPVAEGQINAAGLTLCPGFIDLHMHGTAGYRTDQDAPALSALSGLLPRFGVTGFLAAVTPQPDDAAKLRELAVAAPAGAALLGFFLEGSYLTLTGSLRRTALDNTVEGVRRRREAAYPYPLVFGVSPELEGLEALLPHMTDGGVPAFITHTGATTEQTARAIALGARHATHFYDVFPYPGDREPGVRGCGVVEQVLADSGVSVDFILDGVHAEPAAVRLALACKDPGQVCLITDANSCAGLPAGVYDGLEGQTVVLPGDGGPARYLEPDGSPGYLVGSGLTMDQAVRNAVKLLGLPLEQAVAMASGNPAAVLGIAGRKGKVSPGYDADLILLDGGLRVRASYVSGRLVYAANDTKI